MLWLALYLPRFAVDVRCRGAAHPGPVVVAEEAARGRRLRACSQEALDQGLAPGMAVAAARARLPGVIVHEPDAGLEAAALEGLAAWAGQFSSRVHPLDGAGLVLEVGGSRRLFGGLDPLWSAALGGAEALGYQVAAALGPTPLGAWYLARGAPGTRATDLGDLRRCLAPLPLTVMELPGAVVEALSGMGITSLGALEALPRDGLARRLGGHVLEHLDRAWGRRPDPRRPHVPEPGFRARLVLPFPVTETEALFFPLRRLMEELEGRLRAAAAGVQGLAVVLVHDGGGETRLPVGMRSPTREAGRCLGLLRQALERVDLPAPVLEVGLVAGALVPLGPEQLGLLPAEEAPGAGVDGLLERLQARLGEGAVRCLASVADPRPERSWRKGAPEAAGSAASPAPPAPGPRPLWLLPRPLALGEEAGSPCLGGRLRLALGPERIEGGWWDGDDVSRDYYVAESAGGRVLWVYRERRDGGWFLHGLFA